jgi:hypothetical protein
VAIVVEEFRLIKQGEKDRVLEIFVHGNGDYNLQVDGDSHYYGYLVTRETLVETLTRFIKQYRYRLSPVGERMRGSIVPEDLVSDEEDISIKRVRRRRTETEQEPRRVRRRSI